MIWLDLPIQKQQAASRACKVTHSATPLAKVSPVMSDRRATLNQYEYRPLGLDNGSLAMKVMI